MKKYVLISIFDNDIKYTKHNGFEAAAKEMKKQWLSDFRDYLTDVIDKSKVEDDVEEKLQVAGYFSCEQSHRSGEYFDADIDIKNGNASLTSINSISEWKILPVKTSLLLVSVRGREISYRTFCEFTDAHCVMKEEFLEALVNSASADVGSDELSKLAEKSELAEELNYSLPFEGVECGLDAASASINESSTFCNCSWRIIPLMCVTDETFTPEQFVFFVTGQRYMFNSNVVSPLKQITNLLCKNRANYKSYSLSELGEIIENSNKIFFSVDVTDTNKHGAEIRWFDVSELFAIE